VIAAGDPTELIANGYIRNAVPAHSENVRMGGLVVTIWTLTALLLAAVRRWGMIPVRHELWKRAGVWWRAARDRANFAAFEEASWPPSRTPRAPRLSAGRRTFPRVCDPCAVPGGAPWASSWG
jgi:hypothetical protein